MKMLLAALCLAVAARAQCPQLNPSPIPDDVSELDVTHIRALAAMGDSITAGFGISNSILEIKSEVFSIGGADRAVTLATIMKSQNPNITGASTLFNDGFNVAVSGAVVRNMPSQASTLVRRFQNSRDINFVQDWKMVTIWIGGNNICQHCLLPLPEHTPAYYGRALSEALENLYDNVPRVVVNLVTQFNFSSMYDATGRFPSCFINRLACPCVMSDLPLMRRRADVYCQDLNAEMRAVVDKFNSGPRRDFGVILQTMGVDSLIPDRSILSTFDCFHPNRAAHQALGINTYNELFKRPQDKTTVINFAPNVECATENNKRIFMG